MSALHRIADDLEDGVEALATESLVELERTLAKHAAFAEYLQDRGEA